VDAGFDRAGLGRRGGPTSGLVVLGVLLYAVLLGRHAGQLRERGGQEQRGGEHSSRHLGHRGLS
jgi:hypothetical protein